MALDVNLNPSSELSYVVGVGVGDAYVGKCAHGRGFSYQFHLCVKDKDFAEKLARCLEKVIIGHKGPYHVYKNARGYFEVCAQSKFLYEFFKDKSVEDFKCVKLYPIDFIRGFFDSEGCVHTGKTARGCHISMSNTNLALIEYIKKLLIKLDISPFFTFSYLESGKIFYNLVVKRYEDMIRFISLIDTSIGRKREKMKELNRIVSKRLLYWKNMQEKKIKSIQLRKEGFTTREIGRSLKIGKTTAWNWVKPIG